MNESDIGVFIDGVVRYYFQTADADIRVEAPFLIRDTNQQLSEFSGRIHISGGYTGDVIFTAPKPMLTMLLERYGEKNTGDEYLLDLAGEIANTIAGNAREFFGSRFDLSPPVVATGDITGLFSQRELKTYCIPVSWENQTAKLLIAIE